MFHHLFRCTYSIFNIIIPMDSIYFSTHINSFKYSLFKVEISNFCKSLANEVLNIKYWIIFSSNPGDLMLESGAYKVF